MSVLLICSITGCKEKRPAFVPLPLNVNGTEILLGEATLQTFVDAGYKVTLDRELEEDIEGERMPPMTYDVDNILVDGVNFKGVVVASFVS